MNKITDELHHRCPLTIVSCILLTGFFVAETTHAQQWLFQPELRVGAEYDDNARLSTNEANIEEIDGYILEGSLGISYNTPRTMFELTPKLRSRVYDETPDVDSDDQFLDLTFAHETLKGSFRVRSQFDRESQRTGERGDPEFDVDEPDEIPTDDTGFVLSSERRERFRLIPQWEYELTERLTVGLEAMYSDVSYDDSITSSLVDYTDKRVEGSLAREFTERTRAYVAMRARNYDNDLGLNEVDGLGAAVGIESEISPTTSIRAEVGYEDTEQVITGESDSNFTANLSLVRTLETITMLAQYRRDVAASGAGRVSALDSLNFTLRKQFTERVSGALGLRGTQREGVGQQALTTEERELIQFRTQLSVALSQAFSVEAEYRHSRVDRTTQEGTAESNGIILWLVYHPTPIIR